MVTNYQVSNINYNRVYIAVIVSVIAHMVIAFYFLYKNTAPVYLDNGVQAVDSPRISLSLSKIKPVTKVLPKPEAIKPLPVSSPIEKIEEITDDDKTQEQIPLVKNATLKGTRTPPVYPKRALMLKQEGVVLLKALIDVSGNIKDIQIINTSGYAILDKSAIDAVWKWKFEPSVIDGKITISWVQIPVEFIIK